MSVDIGVPQGSTLGPLLFILYVNDMKNCFSNLKVIHFADDSTLYKSFNSTSVVDVVNSDLECLRKWLSVNKLFLNINKTSYMVFDVMQFMPDLILKIGNSTIVRSREHKFLGVYLDDRLTFKPHVEKTAVKISRAIGMLRKIRFFVPKKVLILIHYALVHSVTSYAITTYSSACQSVLSRISRLVNKSLKIATSNEVINMDVCKQEKIFDFQATLKYFTCIKMFQILKTSSHIYFKEKFDRIQIAHNYETRRVNSERLTIPYARLTRCMRSFLVNGTKLWNELPAYIRNSDSLKIFKKELRNFLFT